MTTLKTIGRYDIDRDHSTNWFYVFYSYQTKRVPQDAISGHEIMPAAIAAAQRYAAADRRRAHD